MLKIHAAYGGSIPTIDIGNYATITLATNGGKHCILQLLRSSLSQGQSLVFILEDGSNFKRFHADLLSL